MARLVLLGGAPGVGKSTLADALARRLPDGVALDLDAAKHALASWPDRPEEAGLEARRRAVRAARGHLAAGRDVVLGQYLARPAFAEELERLAADSGAHFVEVVLRVDADVLAGRLAARAAAPTRPEHAVNDRLVGPTDAPRLVASVERMGRLRPDALVVEAAGTSAETLAELLALLAVGEREG